MASSTFAETSLGEVADFRNGKAISPEKYTRAGKYPVFGSNGQIACSDEMLYAAPAIVIGRVGAYCGCVHYVPRASWVTDNAIVALPKDGNDIRFLFYLLGSLELQRTAIGSAQPLMTQGGLKVVRTKVPPLAEQKAIASILGALDDKIELNRRMNGTLEAMARALFQSWFVDFDPVRAKLDGRQPANLDPAALFPDSFQESSLGHIPIGWNVGRITACCERIHSGGTPRRDQPQYWNEGAIPWLTSGEVRQSMITTTENFITDLGLKESAAKWVPENATVVALYGATAGQVSFLGTSATTNQAVCSLIAKPQFEFFNYFVMRNATAEMENKAVGSAQQNISKGIIEETAVVLPPTELLTQFNLAVAPLFNAWIENIKQSRTLAVLRDTLLPKLLSGELSVDAVASEVTSA